MKSIIEALLTGLSREDSTAVKYTLSRRNGGIRLCTLPTVAFVWLMICSGVNADTFSVNGRSGPWQYVNGGINTAFQFGVNDHQAPTIISSLGGSLFAGEQIQLTYQSGTVNPASTGFPPGNSFVNAGGVLAFPNPYLADPNNINGKFPSAYMGESVGSPIYLAELVGTFANNAGQIVGSPFAIGNGPTTVVVPAGASRLQLGVNDNLFGDNVGSWTIDVTVVPEPGVFSLLGLGAFVSFFAWRKGGAGGTVRN